VRYVTIPPAAMFKGQRLDMGAVLSQLVLPDPRWRDEWAEQWNDAQPEIAALSGAMPGSVVSVSDEAHERCAQSVKVAIVHPEFLPVAMPFIHAITRAARVKPQGGRDE
jgi:hypothetical protein